MKNSECYMLAFRGNRVFACYCPPSGEVYLLTPEEGEPVAYWTNGREMKVGSLPYPNLYGCHAQMLRYGFQRCQDVPSWNEEKQLNSYLRSWCACLLARAEAAGFPEPEAWGIVCPPEWHGIHAMDIELQFSAAGFYRPVCLSELSLAMEHAGKAQEDMYSLMVNVTPFYVYAQLYRGRTLEQGTEMPLGGEIVNLMLSIAVLNDARSLQMLHQDPELSLPLAGLLAHKIKQDERFRGWLSAMGGLLNESYTYAVEQKGLCQDSFMIECQGDSEMGDFALLAHRELVTSVLSECSIREVLGAELFHSLPFVQQELISDFSWSKMFLHYLETVLNNAKLINKGKLIVVIPGCSCQVYESRRLLQQMIGVDPTQLSLYELCVSVCGQVRRKTPSDFRVLDTYWKIMN